MLTSDHLLHDIYIPNNYLKGHMFFDLSVMLQVEFCNYFRKTPHLCCLTGSEYVYIYLSDMKWYILQQIDKINESIEKRRTLIRNKFKKVTANQINTRDTTKINGNNRNLLHKKGLE